MKSIRCNDDNIIKTIRNLDLNKARGHDDITVEMISVTS